MATPNGRIEPADVHHENVADVMFHATTETLVAMYREGGTDRTVASLELGRRAVNKQVKNSKKRASA